eukprot:TRINITY_DN24131_c0_g1_i1.p1 TRINITY_DN24131_c0_g1~~TRINITY_DN24131_c0_g1_i1.p1  ORF type:complete len:177 (-),score=21.89 TRINITY_DN24131_c0_g1_i1:91-621(-)
MLFATSTGGCLLLAALAAAQLRGGGVQADAPKYYNFERKPLQITGHVTELIHGDHLDNLWSDIPDYMRPPMFIFFHDHSAESEAAGLRFESVARDPSFLLGKVLFAKFDAVEGPQRLWYEYIPERNITGRFGVEKYPTVVFFPRQCNGETKWCEHSDGTVGGDCYVEQCKGWSHWY